MKPLLIWIIILLSGVGLHAGDSIADTDGSYAGTASRSCWQKSAGEYAGGIFPNGCLSDRFGRYAGQINANGSITRADGSYGGFVSNWDPAE